MSNATSKASPLSEQREHLPFVVRVLNRILKPAPRLALYKLYRRCYERFLRWYMFYSLFRSFRGHIGILRTIKHQSVDLGPGFERLLDGRLVLNKKTAARSDGTRQLSSKYPWATLADVQIFLLGFDLGFQSGTDNASNGASISFQSSQPPISEGSNSMPPSEVQQAPRRGH